MAVQKQDDQLEHTFSSYVRIRYVVLKTCLGRWTIGRSGERGSGISVLPAQHDDDDDNEKKLDGTIIYKYMRLHQNSRKWHLARINSTYPTPVEQIIKHIYGSVILNINRAFLFVLGLNQFQISGLK